MQQLDSTFTIPFPETADIETSSEDYARRFAGPVGAWFLKVQEQGTLQMLRAYPRATILDVGGGHAQVTEALIGAGFHLTVLGSAASCAERLRPFLQSGQVNFEIGNVIDLPYPSGAFDVVLSYRLLPHVERWDELLREMARVAKKAVVLDYPEANSLNLIAPSLFGFKKKLEGNTRPFTLFRQKQIVDVLERHGFGYGDRFAEFFLPMVLHRKLKSPGLSAGMETICRKLGLTGRWGSPVILKMVRKADGGY